MTTATTLSRAAAGLLALCIGSGGNLLAAASPAAATPGEGPVVETIVEKKDETIIEKIDDKINAAIGAETIATIEDIHAEQAHFFGELFGTLDRVFGEHYMEDRERKVQVLFGLETTFNDKGTGAETGLKLDLRVPLPALDRRLNAFISIGGSANELGSVSDPQFSEADKDFSLGASLLRRFRKNLELGLNLKLLSSGEVFLVYPFARFEWQGDSMRYFFEQQVIWQSDNSWRTLTDFDIDRRFRSGLFLRLRNRIDYPFDESGASIAHGLIVRRGFMDTSGLSLELWLEYNTAPDNPAEIGDDTIAYAQLRLRGRIWRKWIEYELRPIYTVPIDTDRGSFFGFYVSLAVVWDSYFGGGDIPAANLDR